MKKKERGENVTAKKKKKGLKKKNSNAGIEPATS